MVWGSTVKIEGPTDLAGGPRLVFSGASGTLVQKGWAHWKGAPPSV